MRAGVSRLRTATDGVNRRTGSIDELKRRTLEELDIIETGVSHYAATIPETAPHPVVLRIFFIFLILSYLFQVT